MSSSSPPKNPSPASSGSASPDFERIDYDDDDDYDQEEMFSDPQLDPNLVYTPQPISSYHPNLPDVSKIYSEIDPQTADYIKSQGLDMSDIMNQKELLSSYHPNLPDPSTMYSQIDPETACFIKSQGIDMSEIMNQRQTIDYWNRRKQSLPQDHAGIPRTESPTLVIKPRKETRKEEARRWLESQIKEDSDKVKETLFKKRRLKLPDLNQKPAGKSKMKTPADNEEKEEDGFLLPLSESEREDDYETLKFLLAYVLGGGILAPKFESSVVHFINGVLAENYKITVSRYRKKVTELYKKFLQIVQQNGGKDFSEANFFTRREYEMAEMCKIVWRDGQERRGFGFPVDRVKAPFRSELDPTPAPVIRVSDAGIKLKFKAPRAVNVKSRDTELEADTARAIANSIKEVPDDNKGKRIEDQPAPKIDTLPLKKRKIDTLAEATDNKLSKRRKLSDSPPKHDENPMQEEEEEELLLPYANNEEDDDYGTLRYLFWYTMDQRTYIWLRGTFVPNFENAVTEYINAHLPNSCKKITTGQCRKKVMELGNKFLRFKELNGEDLSEADFSVASEYKMFQMFKTVWNVGQGSGAGADPDSCPKPNVDQLGSNVEQGINVGNAVQGASGDLNMNVDPGNLEVPGVNVDQGNVADATSSSNYPRSLTYHRRFPKGKKG